MRMNKSILLFVIIMFLMITAIVVVLNTPHPTFVSKVERHKDNGKYIIEFKQAGNYELLNSLEQSVLLIHVGEKEKSVTLPLLTEDIYFLKNNHLKEKLEATK